MGMSRTNSVRASVMLWVWSVKTPGSGQPSMCPMPMWNSGMRNTIEMMRRVRMAEAAASSFLVGDSMWAAPDLACVLPFEPAAPVPASTGEAE